MQTERMANAAIDAVAIALRYARSGRSLAHAALAGAVQCVSLRHYPVNDVVDALHGTRFYYHAHRSLRRPGQEHGHFHLFVHSGESNDFVHLAGLSLNARGEPIRWFTTNCWVTGERWHDAAEVLQALHRFEVHAHGRMASLARWLTAMVRLFEPQLEVLIRRRDVIMHRKSGVQGWSALCEDRRLDVVSQCSAALPARIQQFQQRGH